MNDEETYAPFWDHIEDLRRTLLRVFIIIAAGVFLSFIFYAQILTVLTRPFQSIVKNNTAFHEEKLETRRIVNASSEEQEFKLPENALPPIDISPGTQQIDSTTYRIPSNGYVTFNKNVPASSSLVILGPLEGMMIALKTSLWLGGIATSPLWLWEILQFITPALHTHERRLVWPFLGMSVLFIAIGCLFAFSITIPIANKYLASFNTMIGTNLWSLTHYLDYTLFLLLANGLAFELCVVGIFAVHLGLLTSESLSNKRRIAYVTAFIISALLTPPDVVTQVMMAVPLICLYEVLILYSRLRTCSKSFSS